jgi:hypothetical protein
MPIGKNNLLLGNRSNNSAPRFLDCRSGGAASPDISSLRHLDIDEGWNCQFRTLPKQCAEFFKMFSIGAKFLTLPIPILGKNGGGQTETQKEHNTTFHHPLIILKYPLIKTGVAKTNAPSRVLSAMVYSKTPHAIPQTTRTKTIAALKGF